MPLPLDKRIGNIIVTLQFLRKGSEKDKTIEAAVQKIEKILNIK